MLADLESIVCKFGGDPAICLREVMVSENDVHYVYIVYILRDIQTDKLITILRSRERAK